MRSLQSDIEQRGTRIFQLVDKHPERLFSKAGFYQRLMALSMHDERFKTQLFRFVAVLPSLRGSSEIIQHLEEYFSDAPRPVDKRSRPTMECFRNGSPVYCWTKFG
jgi:RHH-type proline utilization regulon transcriptional repressor/proline dehydrogenase/delta 1-pyrroline-5-carboxylate dehydrogenase